MCVLMFLLLLLILFPVDGLPAYQPMICEYYDPHECKKDSNQCNATIVCEKPENGKRSHCYAFLTNTTGTLVLSKKGCWLDDFQCYNETKCIAKDEGKGNFYCCCEGSMCNVNVTVSTYRPTPTVVPVMPCCDQTILKTLLSSLFPLICIAVIVILLFLFWRCRQPSYIEQIEAARDKPLLPASPPSPLPAASLRTIKLLEEKARGRYGSVHKAQMGGELVAVKVFPCQVRHSWVDERDFYNLPHINNHDNILRFIAAEKRDPQYWLITEFHHRGSLYDHLKGKTVSWNEARRIMVTMTNGLVFLHGNLPTTELLPGKPSIAHRDLKSRNILLKDDMSACLADFGLALVLNGDMDTLPGQVGTRRYMAPEVLDGSIMFHPIYMLKIDIYAYALVLWEIVSRCTAVGSGMLKEYEMPFQNEVGEHPTLEDMQVAVVNKKLRPALDPIWCQNEDLEIVCRTIEECWDQDPEARLTAECLCERFNRTSIYLSSSLDCGSTLPLPPASLSKDQSSTSSSSVDDSSSIA